ncbi:MAG: hypothetical protein JW729_06930 [Bacteroidales bacterium]|nr:hypothetical protein [Bacteroidales bacterium]
MRTKKQSNTDLLDKNPNNWRGPFYYNPADFRIIVPKHNPKFGITLNFGNIFTYLVLAGLIAIIISLNLVL